ncbi:unnamed protein product [Moneuplotes crassus]|uniref:Uncharacterized protein n=1 Tax=Euplotes crassus TaxID=5936 RepID=A0AAD1Y5B6_EUPCR|nr:unnamed protein product [Moneuplotes crassus]
MEKRNKVVPQDKGELENTIEELLEKEEINEGIRKAPDTDLPKEENKEDWEEEKASQDPQNNADPKYNIEESSEEEPVREDESQNHTKYLNDEDRFDLKKRKSTEKIRKLNQAEKEGDEWKENHNLKKRFSEMTEEEIEELKEQHLKKCKEAREEGAQIKEKERAKLKNKPIMIGDQIIFKTYCKKLGKYKYLTLNGFHLDWREEICDKSILTIESLLVDKSKTFTYQGGLPSQFPPNSEWENKDVQDMYEDVLENVAINCSFIKKATRRPLNKNQKFCLATEAPMILMFSTKLKNVEFSTNEWEITRIKESDVKAGVYPNTSYYLSTLYHNKFISLGKYDHSLTHEEEDKAIIELETINKNNQENEDEAHKQINQYKSFCIFDEESQCINISQNYFDEPLHDPKEECRINVMKYDSLSRIPFKNYFKIEYFPTQSRIKFQTEFKYFNQLFNQYSEKYFGYEDGKLTLVDYEYFFEVELDGRDENGLIWNNPFRIKIPNSDKYLRSIPSIQKGVNELVVTKCDFQDQNSFYFYLQHIQPPSTSAFRIFNCRYFRKDSFKSFERIAKREMENFNPDDLIQLYKGIKSSLHWSFEMFTSKEHTKENIQYCKSMCSNGYINIKETSFLSQFWNLWKKEFRILKQIRQELIRRKEKLSRIDICSELDYYAHCEYMLAFCCSESKYQISSILKLAKHIVTDQEECAELNNDSRQECFNIRKLLMLTTIVNMTYRDGFIRSKSKSINVYEVESFLPFIQYELTKTNDKLTKENDSEINKENEKCNFSLLLGIVSNKFRDQNVIWSYDGLNYAVIEYLGDYLLDHIRDIKDLDFTEMNKASLSYKKKKCEDQDFCELMFYEGRKEAAIMSYNQNNSLLKLVKIVIYSFTFKDGNNDADLITKWNKLISQGYSDNELCSHIKGLLVILFSNINFPSQNCESSLKIDEGDLNKIIDCNLETLSSFNASDSAEDCFLLCEILGLIICMLQSSECQQFILTKLKQKGSLKSIIKLLSSLSEIFILPKPHAFDETEGMQYYSGRLIEANQRATNDIFHDVDVVIDSYKREIIYKIFKTLNIIFEINNKEENQKMSCKSFPFISEIMSDSSSEEYLELIKTLQKVIIKWLNFDFELEASLEIFDLIGKLDLNCQNLPQQYDENRQQNQYLSRLSLSCLPFFNLSKREHESLVIPFLKEIHKIQNNFTNPEEFSLTEEDLHKQHIKGIYTIITFLVKVNGLLDFTGDVDLNCIKAANRYVSSCYECIIEAVQYSSIAKAVWKFNGFFFTILWQNKFCNDLHLEMIKQILIRSEFEQFNLDSLDLLRKIDLKREILIEKEGKIIFEEIDLQKENDGINEERKMFEKSEKFLEYFIQIITKNSLCGAAEEIKPIANKNSDPYCKYFSVGSIIDIGNEKINSKLMRTMIDQFINDCQSPDIKKSRECTRKFQLLINKFFSRLDDLAPLFDTKSFIYHILKMLNEILDNQQIMMNSEIKYIFCTKHATNTLFSLIIKEYNYTECASRVRQFAYELLIKIMKASTSEARKSFRRWTYINDNERRLFNRINRICEQFSDFFLNEKLALMTGANLEKTDFGELLFSLEWLAILCDNNCHWQENLKKQDFSSQNESIVHAVVNLMRTSVLRLNHEYVIDLLRVIVKFITASVNGRNEFLTNQYADSNVVRYSMEILQNGFSEEEVKFLTKVQKDSCFKIMSNEIEEYQKPIDLQRFQKYNLLKQEVLCMLNLLLLPTTKHHIQNQDNYAIVNNLMVLNYVQFRICYGQIYSSKLSNSESELAKIYNINLGFQCYYLINKIWNNNGQPDSNCVQKFDTEGLSEKYWRLLTSLYFCLTNYKNKYGIISSIRYQPFEENQNLVAESTDFFDSYSSNIEIVMENGKLITRHFEILPCFLSFTQTEKDNFWLEANLDNSKTTVASFMEFANDKIEELFIQQKVQGYWICPRDVTKKNNWLTDVGRFLVLAVNFILFFGLEVNDGKTLDNPQLFGLASKLTRLLLYILGSINLAFFFYMTIIQGIIVLKLQEKRAIKESEENKKKGKCFHYLKVFWYTIRNKEETLQARSIWCILLCLGFSVAGVFIDFFWFSFTMSYLIIFSPHILEVTNAVWNPKKRILSTVALSAIILYWFAIVAFVYFGNDFNGVVKDSNIALVNCLIVIFDSWYKFGLGAFLADNGRSAIMEEDAGENLYKPKGPRIWYDFFFYFFVPTLLLNILSGIIIDNFGERRSNSDTIRQRQNDQCFVCGKLSSDLPDFVQHCRFKHNIWDYMYYIGYLKAMLESERTDYRDIHVHACLEQNKNDWFPAYRDFVKEKAKKKKSTDILGDAIQDSKDKEDQYQMDSEESDIDEGVKEIRELRKEIIVNEKRIEEKIEQQMSEMKSILKEILPKQNFTK